MRSIASSSRILAIYARTFGHQFHVRAHAGDDTFSLSGPSSLKLSTFALPPNTNTTDIPSSTTTEHKAGTTSPAHMIHYPNNVDIAQQPIDGSHLQPAFTYRYTPNAIFEIL
jgi:hypothetical protein